VDKSRAYHRVKGLTELNHITKYAVSLSKEKRLRDTLDFLRQTDTTPEKGSRKSSEMAEIARDYNSNLQRDGEDICPRAREDALEDALGLLPLTQHRANMWDLERKLNKADTSQAVNEAVAGKVSGMNGLISEFWKCLSEMFDESQKQKDTSKTQKKRGNIINVLTWVYNNIEDWHN
jgi:hypothetical protein